MKELIDIERKSNGVCIKFQIDITGSSLPRFKDRVKDVCQNTKNMELDFQNVEMVDSMGIGFIVAVCNSMKKNNGVLKIINISSELLDLFTSMHLNQHIELAGE